MNKIAPLIIFDFETGGLDCTKNPVTEFAGISLNLDTLEQIDSFECLFTYYDAELNYDDDALKISGISHELISGGLELKDAISGITNFFEKSKIHGNGKGFLPILVGHNVQFDIGFLQQIFNKSNKKLDKFIQGNNDYYGNFQPKSIDTMDLSKMSWGNNSEIPNYKLITCIENAGLELNDAHRAMNDVRGTVELIRNFIQKLRSNGQDIESELIKLNYRENHFKI